MSDNEEKPAAAAEEPSKPENEPGKPENEPGKPENEPGKPEEQAQATSAADGAAAASPEDTPGAPAEEKTPASAGAATEAEAAPAAESGEKEEGLQDGTTDEAPAAAADEAAAAAAEAPTGNGDGGEGAGGEQEKQEEAEDDADADANVITEEPRKQSIPDPAEADKPPLRLEQQEFNADYCSCGVAKGERTSLFYNVVFSNKKGAKFSRENITELLSAHELTVCFRGRALDGSFHKAALKLSFVGQPVMEKMINSLAQSKMSSILLDCKNVASIDNKKNWTKAFDGKALQWKTGTKRCEVYILTAKTQEQVDAVFSFHSDYVHKWRARPSFCCPCIGCICCHLANTAEVKFPRQARLNYM